MKIMAIGDPHGDLDEVRKIPIENVDLILLIGDLGRADLMKNSIGLHKKTTTQIHILRTHSRRTGAFEDRGNRSL